MVYDKQAAADMPVPLLRNQAPSCCRPFRRPCLVRLATVLPAAVPSPLLDLVLRRRETAAWFFSHRRRGASELAPTRHVADKAVALRHRHGGRSEERMAELRTVSEGHSRTGAKPEGVQCGTVLSGARFTTSGVATRRGAVAAGDGRFSTELVLNSFPRLLSWIFAAAADCCPRLR